MLHLPLGNATWSCINKRFTVWLLSQPISLSGPQWFWSLHAEIPWVHQTWSSVSSICTPEKFLRTKVMESRIFILFSNFEFCCSVLFLQLRPKAPGPEYNTQCFSFFFHICKFKSYINIDMLLTRPTLRNMTMFFFPGFLFVFFVFVCSFYTFKTRLLT